MKMAVQMAKHVGVCVCGFPVADHFTKTGRKRSCEDVLRLAVMTANDVLLETQAPASANAKHQRPSVVAQTRARLQLVKSDRRKVRR